MAIGQAGHALSKASLPPGNLGLMVTTPAIAWQPGAHGYNAGNSLVGASLKAVS